MKSEAEIRQARKIIAARIASGLCGDSISTRQMTLIIGMLNGLAWACDSDNGRTTEDVLAGRPFAPGLEMEIDDGKT